MLGCRPGLMRFAWPGWVICAWFWFWLAWFVWFWFWFVWFWFVWLGRLAWFWLVWFWFWFWLAWFSLGGRVSYSSRICLTPARMLANDAASIFSAIGVFVFEGRTLTKFVN